MPTTLNDPDVRELLANPNYAVVSTRNRNGSIHNVGPANSESSS